MTLSVQLNPNGATVNKLEVKEFNYECKVANHICYGWFYTSISFSGSYPTSSNQPKFYIPELPAPLISVAYGYMYMNTNSIRRVKIHDIRSGGVHYEICLIGSNNYNIEFKYMY